MSDSENKNGWLLGKFRSFMYGLVDAEDKSWAIADKWLDFTKIYFDFLKNLSVVVLLQVLAEKTNSISLYAAALISYSILMIYVFFLISKTFRLARFVSEKHGPVRITVVGTILAIIVYFSLKLTLAGVNDVMFALIGAQKN